MSSFFKATAILLVTFLLLGQYSSLLSQKAYAQNSDVTPTFNCLAADCPTTPGATSPLPATASLAAEPFANQPCNNPLDSLSPSTLPAQAPNQNNSHNSTRGGFLEVFFQFIIAIIELVLQTGSTDGTAPCAPTISVPSVAPAIVSPPVSTGSATIPSSGTITTDPTANWAGYATQSSPSPNGYITTNWNITKVDCSAGDGHASSWPGMGGRKDDPNIAQVGTAVVCTNGSYQFGYYGWTESYPNPVAPLDSNKYPVAIGDQLTATITFQGNGKFATVMMNKTKGWMLNMPMTFEATYVPKSSEVITESADNYPVVPKFDTIIYPGNVYSPDGVQKIPLGAAPNLVKVTNVDANNILRTDVSPFTGDTFSTPWTHN